MALAMAPLLGGCRDDSMPTQAAPTADAVAAPSVEGRRQLVASGKEIFRFDTFDDERFWTDTARLHEVIQQALTPNLALQLGLKVDVNALPASLREAILAGQVDLDDPATTVALLKLDAVVGVRGTVRTEEGRDVLVRAGITCALCHSTVNNSLAPGIGERLDGWPNRDLDAGKIIALSPAIPPEKKEVYRSWGPGMYDPRFNIDGISRPVVMPPAFGLADVAKEIYTGDGPISYWNAYVAVTQMHGQGTFVDPRLGISIVKTPDLVTPKLPALLAYQLTLRTPRPLRGAFEPAAAARGRLVFRGDGRCSTCHVGRVLTDINLGVLHAPAETGMEPLYASRSVTKMYRTTPLRGLWHPPQLAGPYFHDGSAATLDDVVEHYDKVLDLKLTDRQKADLVQYLRSL